MDDVFKALADPSRRELLDRLFRRNGQTLLELSHGLEMTRFGVMKHLAILEQAGLITTTKVGREKHHYLNPVPIRLVHDRWVSKYAAPFAAALARLKHTLETPVPGDAVKLYQTFIRATPKPVWRAITGPAFAKLVPSVFAIDVAERESPSRLVHTLTASDDRSEPREIARLTWRLEPQGRLTKLSVEQDASSAPLVAQRMSNERWAFILSGIKTLVETGKPIPKISKSEG